jgi:DsbC/DsbD-like thiol-disulfide interchange protein
MLVALEAYLDARPGGGGAAVAAAAAPPAPDNALPDDQSVITATAAPTPGAVIAPGGEFEVVVTLAIQDGWHLYANPAGVATLRPTTLALASGQPATLSTVNYPAGTPAPAIPVSDEKALVYEHAVKLTARLRLDAQARPGPLTLRLTVAYQACNDRACLAPASLAVPLKLMISR